MVECKQIPFLSLAMVVCVSLLISGCGAADISIPTPTVIVVTPSQGQSLKHFGYTYDPADLIWLPTDTQLTYAANQPNTLIAVGYASQASEVQTYLTQVLPGLGWKITAESDGALLFEQGEWQGGYALGDNDWALTVRNDEVRR